jgi:HEAT repeat protein
LSVETVITALNDPDHVPPATSLAQLSNLSGNDLERVSGAFRSLSIQRRRDVIDVLADLAEDNVELSFDAVFELGLDDSDVQVRAQSIRALWENEEAGVARRLLSMVANDPEAMVRSEAAAALGLFLTRAELDGTDDQLTSAIEEALRSVYYDEGQLVEVRGRALEALGVRSDEWVADLISEAYESGDRRLSISAIQAMGRSADPRWLPTVVDQMVSEDGEMRYEAATAAGEIGDEDAVPALAELMNDEDAEVQEAAISALGAIGGQAARSVLQAVASEHDDERVIEAVTEALAQADFLENPMAFKLYLDREDADDEEDA